MIYILRSTVNPALVLATTGEWTHLIGPGGYSARVYRTLRGAENALVRLGRSFTARVEPCA